VAQSGRKKVRKRGDRGGIGGAGASRHLQSRSNPGGKRLDPSRLPEILKEAQAFEPAPRKRGGVDREAERQVVVVLIQRGASNTEIMAWAKARDFVLGAGLIQRVRKSLKSGESEPAPPGGGRGGNPVGDRGTGGGRGEFGEV
jgi:hypothetical protein